MVVKNVLLAQSIELIDLILQIRCSNCANVLAVMAEEMERANCSKTSTKKQADALQGEVCVCVFVLV